MGGGTECADSVLKIIILIVHLTLFYKLCTYFHHVKTRKSDFNNCTVTCMYMYGLLNP